MVQASGLLSGEGGTAPEAASRVFLAEAVAVRPGELRNPARLPHRWAGMELTCPKYSGPMRTYERNGGPVDQCAESRGILLDRGELDRLIDAENAWHGASRETP